MEITSIFFLYILLLSWVSLTITGYGPAPAPESGDSIGLSPDYDKMSEPPALSPAMGISGAPAPGLGEESSGDLSSPPPVKSDPWTVKWCAVKDEFVDCQNYLNLLGQKENYTWECVKRETTEACLESIKKGEADLINLEAGLAYIAFLNYSMKAIANEVYCNHAESYEAVAIVNKKLCKHGEEEISLVDFKGKRSCHGGYSTAMGWNYPVNHLKNLTSSQQLNDEEIVTGFFSKVCAPSEFESKGICSGCGNENGSCSESNLYSGHSGAFRCLVEDMGDIAFVKGDTALLFSKEGPNNQTWSTKSMSDFMYLCLQGGCREINGYPGDCSFGAVPANVIMTSNSISSKKMSAVLQSLLNATWVDALYTGKNAAGHLLSSSAQGLILVEKLTRSYLGNSASISSSIQEINLKKVEPSAKESVPGLPSSPSTRIQHTWIIATFIVIFSQSFL
ncbi:serotransferrin-like [Papaver somniferum]|uniref:serotransferrin-like n=1 Tax=Papaver somniferum TaxID=3469 RepID=UPI000E6F84A5|nr:serotransferrin-like [Papaver somniferum]